MHFFKSLLAEKAVFPARGPGACERGISEQESNVFANPGRNRGTNASNGRRCCKDEDSPPRTL